MAWRVTAIFQLAIDAHTSARASSARGGRLGEATATVRNERKPMSPTETATRQHTSTGPASPQLPEPTHAERVRTLMSLVPVATLSTLSRKHPGFPFGSLMPFAISLAGRPTFLISD